MNQKKLPLEQLDRKIEGLTTAVQAKVPSTGFF